MTWFFISMVSPILLGIVYFIDEYLLEQKKFKPLTLVLFSGIMGGLLAIGLSLVLTGGSMIVPEMKELVLLISAGVSLFIVTWFYFLALDVIEPSAVAPLYLLSVVFGYILGVIFLDEIILGYKILGMTLVVFGSLVLTVKRVDVLLKHRVLSTFYMMIGSFFLAVDATIFKVIVDSKEDFFWTGTFWEHLGYFGAAFIVTLIVLIFKLFSSLKRKMRRRDSNQEDNSYLSSTSFFKTKYIALANIFNELLSISSNIVINFAILLAPIALVFTVADGFQPLIVLFYGAILAKIKPETFGRNSKNICRKLIAIFLMVIGTALVLF